MKSKFKNIKNEITIEGTVISSLKPSTKFSMGRFKETSISVIRKNGMVDIIPIILPKKQIKNTHILVKGEEVVVEGMIKTNNRYNKGKTTITTYLYVTKISTKKEYRQENGFHVDNNRVKVVAYVYKESRTRSLLRRTTLSSGIVVINKGDVNTFNKDCYYLNIIGFNDMAFECKNLKVGDKVSLEGKLQSKNVYKKARSGEGQTMLFHELVVSKVDIVE